MSLKRLFLFSTFVALFLGTWFLNRVLKPQVCINGDYFKVQIISKTGEKLTAPSCSSFNLFDQVIPNNDLPVVKRVVEVGQLMQSLGVKVKPSHVVVSKASQFEFHRFGNHMFIGYLAANTDDFSLELIKSIINQKKDDISIEQARILAYFLFFAHKGDTRWVSTFSGFSESLGDGHLVNYLMSPKDHCLSDFHSLEINDFCLNLNSMGFEQKENYLKGDLKDGVSSHALVVYTAMIAFEYFEKLDYSKKLRFMKNAVNLTLSFPLTKELSSIVTKRKWSELEKDYSQLVTQLIGGLVGEVDRELFRSIQRKRIDLDSFDFVGISNIGEKVPLSQSVKRSFWINRKGRFLSSNWSELPIELDVKLKESPLAIDTIDDLRAVTWLWKNLDLFSQIIWLIDFDSTLLSKGLTLQSIIFLEETNFVIFSGASLKLALDRANSLTLNKFNAWSELFGWTDVQWSTKELAFFPKAEIDGVLKYRLN